MQRENQRIIVTKRLLKEGLLRLLETKALDKISITELCKESGINRATFYRHYQSPNEVLLDISRDLYAELKARVSFPGSFEETRACLTDLFTYLYEHASLLRLLIQCKSDSDISLLLNELYDELWNELVQAELEKGVDPDSVRLLAAYCGGGAYFMLRQWLLGEIDRTPQEIANLTYGLLRDTGRLLSEGSLALHRRQK